MKKTPVSILDVKIFPTTYDQVLTKIIKVVKRRPTQKNTYICVAAVHLVMECQKDTFLLSGVNRAALVTPDGMPLVWLLKLAGVTAAQRVYGPTLMQKICQLAADYHYRIFLLGGANGQGQVLKNILEKRFPRLKVSGYYETPTRPLSPRQNQEVLTAINKSKTDIVLVGLGCPNQENWMITNQPHLRVPVCIGVGAAFDFISGRVKQAPTWIQALGLEWLFRLIQDPRRLWYRYTVLNTIFVVKILIAAFKRTRRL